MGEVYRGRDATLNRDVAIKVLPGALATDTERLVRFKREVQVLAALSRSNIAHVYGFEAATLADSSTAHFLAMEMVEGEDLAERLSAVRVHRTYADPLSTPARGDRRSGVAQAFRGRNPDHTSRGNPGGTYRGDQRCRHHAEDDEGV